MASIEEEMVDECQIIHNEQALNNHRMFNRIKVPDDWDRKTCHECGSSLPQVRIDNNYYLCVPCKEENEKRSRMIYRGK